MTSGLSRICRLLGSAQEQVIIASAYLGAGTLDRLLEAIPDRVTRTAVIARWDIKDMTSGATDWRAWDVARRYAVPLYACPRLHAKIYVADDLALVGSANATASGLGLGGPGNLELLMPVPTSQEDVSRVLALTEEESVEAMPVGADVTGSDSGDDESMPFWLPDIGPDRFLDALQRRSPHTDHTIKTCSWLHLSKEDRDDRLVRRAVQETTFFRVVKDEMDTRPTPMTVVDLRELLSEKIDARLGQLSSDRLALLVEWLGRFGANTHAVLSAGRATPTLFPGARLASYEITD